MVNTQQSPLTVFILRPFTHCPRVRLPALLLVALLGLAVTGCLPSGSGIPLALGETDKPAPEDDGPKKDGDNGPPVPSAAKPAQKPSIDQEILPQAVAADRCDIIDPNYCLFPFPNNHFTVADNTTDTKRRVNLSILSMPKNVALKPIDPTEWNRNDGFSPNQPILVRIPGLDLAQSKLAPITDIAQSLAFGHPLALVDAETGQRQLAWAELDANLTKQQTALLADEGPALIIRPAKNLEPGRRYVVGLAGLKDSNGQTIAASPGFRIYRDNHTSLLPAIEARRDAMEALFPVLAKAGIARADLNVAWDFTVASARNLTGRMLHMRDTALQQLNNGSPTIRITSVIENPLASQEDPEVKATARRIRGTVEVPCFLTTPNCLPGGRLNYLLDGTRLVAGPNALPSTNPITPTARVPFICSIAGKSLSGPSGAAVPGRAALYGHGLLGSRDEGNTYDFSVRQMAERHNFTFCMVDWAGLAVGNFPDGGQEDPAKYDPLWDAAGGDIVSTFALLADMSGFPRLADRVQQGYLNFIMLGRAMLHPEGLCAQPAFQGSDGNCVIDASQGLYFDGNSQGGINGGALAAVSPDIQAASLGVVGMTYSMLLQRSVDFNTYGMVLYNAYPASLDQAFILSSIQMLWDRAENNGYAFSLAPGRALPGTKPNKRILMSVAFADHQVSMTTAEIMARTIKASLRCPAVVGGRIAQRGPAVLNRINPDVVNEEAMFKDQHVATSFGVRHPDAEPYFGLGCAPSYPHQGNLFTVWDSGPKGVPGGSVNNPNDNRVPVNTGDDPHGHPRSDERNILMRSQFLSPQGLVENPCKAGFPCGTREFRTKVETGVVRP